MKAECLKGKLSWHNQIKRGSDFHDHDLTSNTVCSKTLALDNSGEEEVQPEQLRGGLFLKPVFSFCQVDKVF